MTRDETLYVRQLAGEPNCHVRARDEHVRLSEIMQAAYVRGRQRARIGMYGRLSA